MALTDPELDLLTELLEDDPTADLYLQVGEEYVRRTRWSEARDVLTAGLEGDERPPEAYALLARATLELADYPACLQALRKVDTAPGSEGGRVEILALERAGRTDEAREKAMAYLAVDADDVVVASVIERLEAPPPDQAQRGADPFDTVERAERFVAIGRPDRAVRVYRRILRHHPGDQGIQLRVRELVNGAPFDRPDDLSEELTDPGLVPPEFDMPSPGMGPGGPRGEVDPDAATDPGGAMPRERTPPTNAREGRSSTSRRRRRSLLNP